MAKEYRNEDGRLHRLDGPAIEWADGSKEYWVNGKRHRLDGPAMECKGSKEYWVDGKEYTKEEYELLSIYTHIDNIIEEAILGL